jgi:hypothetical protein
VDDEEKVGVKGEDDALADPPHPADDLTLNGSDRRIDRAEDEWTMENETLEPASDDVTGQRLEVDDNIGELGDVIFSAS